MLKTRLRLESRRVRVETKYGFGKRRLGIGLRRCFGLKRIEFWIEKIKGMVGEEQGSGWIR